MPASMMSAPVGSKPNVIGSSIAIVAIGPTPGSTPISVPTMQPTKQRKMLLSVSATPNPIPRLPKKASIVVYSGSEREERLDHRADHRDRQAQERLEQQDADHGQHDGK